MAGKWRRWAIELLGWLVGPALVWGAVTAFVTSIWAVAEGQPAVFVAIAFLVVMVGVLALLRLGAWLYFLLKRKSPPALKGEVTAIQRELIRLDNRRQLNGGSMWPVERPYRDLPSEQWDATNGSRLRKEDRKAIGDAYALLARFNDAMLCGETIIASAPAQEPDLDGLKAAFADVARRLGISAVPADPNLNSPLRVQAAELSFGSVQMAYNSERIEVTDGVFRWGRILRVPVINAQGAETAASVQVLLTFRPDDTEGWMSPRDPVAAEWDTDPIVTTLDIPGNGHPQLFNVAFVLDEAHPCVFQWTRESRRAGLENGYGIAGKGIVKVEVRGAGPGNAAPTLTDILHIEALNGSLTAMWESEGLGSRRNGVPWRGIPMMGPPPGS